MLVKLIPVILVLSSWPFQYAAGGIYKLVDPVYSRPSDIKFEIENMPRYRSADSFDVCQSISVATLLDFHRCRANRIKDCKRLSPSEEYSTLKINSFAKENTGEIKFRGDPVQALLNLETAKFKAFPESCAPLDQIAEQNKGIIGKANSDLKKLEENYDKYREQYTEGRVCEECIADIKNQLNKNFLTFPEVETIKEALDKRYIFGEFLYDIYFKNCPKNSKIQIQPNPILKVFPEPGSKASYETAINQIKSTLNKGFPLISQAICLERQDSKCKTLHAVVISGYKKLCKPQGSPCRDLVKIHEALGQEFQDKYNGGWVDAQSVLNEFRGKNDLAWLEDPPRK